MVDFRPEFVVLEFLVEVIERIGFMAFHAGCGDFFRLLALQISHARFDRGFIALFFVQVQISFSSTMACLTGDSLFRGRTAFGGMAGQTAFIFGGIFDPMFFGGFFGLVS